MVISAQALARGDEHVKKTLPVKAPRLVVKVHRLFRFLSPYAACVLPFSVGLLSLVYLSVQQYTLNWAVTATPTHAPTSTVIKCATPSPTPPSSSAPLPTSVPIVEFGHLLCAPDALTAKFEKALEVERSQNYTAESWKQAVSASGLAAWRFTTGLVLVTLFGALVISFLIIWFAPRDIPPPHRAAYALYAIVWLVVCTGLFTLMNWRADGLERAAVIARQYLEFIDRQLEHSQVWEWEWKLLYAGYVTVLYMLCASGATLLPDRRKASAAEDKARNLAAKMRYLRLLLYVGAFMLAAGALRGRLNQDWALSYLPPLAAFEGATEQKLAASLIYGRLKTIGSNTVTSVAFLNTLLLAAIYVPAALVLQRRADNLFETTSQASRAEMASGDAETKKGVEGKPAKSGDKSGDKPTSGREEWMKEHGLSFPLKDHLGRVAAILSPLLAGPLGDLLSFVKG